MRYRFIERKTRGSMHTDSYLALDNSNRPIRRENGADLVIKRHVPTRKKK